MKYLLVFGVILVAIWIWRNNRLSDGDSKPQPPRARNPPAAPARMLACSQCGTHLPETEAIKGKQGVYCCQEHRRQHEE